jgi:phage-related protein
LSKNSKAKRDKKKTVERKRSAANASTRINFDNAIAVQRAMEQLFNNKLLTTPKEINSDILDFCAKISENTPFFITSEPEPWSRQQCCDRNVKEYIALHGGEIVCGYRIWFNDPSYIEAERHAIWHNSGMYKDISFSPDGEQTFLFVADQVEKIGSLEDNVPRLRWGKDYDTRRLIEIQQDMESYLHVGRMTDEQAWNTMPSYAEWQGGKRMSALISPQEVVELNV